MKRNISLEEISDGRLYSSSDMVRLGTDDCSGCHACCQGMGNTVILDPMDICRLCEGLSCSPGELFASGLQLNVVDGIILPNLKMDGDLERCVYLNNEGRCGIHEYRPGICRLFPLGRYYRDGGFDYFLQVNECLKERKNKIKIKSWIDIADIKRYEKYINDWHGLLMELEKNIELNDDEEFTRNLNTYILKIFFMREYGSLEGFYEEFYKRFDSVRALI